MRLPTDIIVQRYADSLFRASFNVCRSIEDAEDAVQETLLQYHCSDKEFESEEHIRAWLLRVVINKAKNTVRSFWNRSKTPLEEITETPVFESREDEALFESVMQLPEMYRIVIHLFYYEDCTVKQISEIMSVSESNVKVRLLRARLMLKDLLQED